MNKFTCTGRLMYDPTYRQAAGVDVADFTLSVNTRGKNDQGYPNSVVIKCTVWRKQAELMKKFQICKGKRVAVSGMIDLERYKTREGVDRVNLTLDVEDLDFMLDTTTMPEKTDMPAQAAPAEPAPAPMLVDEEPPF